jgi:serine/threonine protein kinase
MELCEAGCVQALIEKEKTLTEQAIAPIVKSILGGLAYMHERLFAHRDIKPGNVLLTSAGRIKLADFGISSTGRSRMQTMIGTPCFLAPEIVAGDEEKGYTAKVDVWAVGISIIYMAQGEPPFYRLNPMRALFMISQAESPTFAEPSKWSPALNQLLAALLQKDDVQRISCQQALQYDFCKNAGKMCFGVAEKNV